MERLLELADPKCESVGETRTRLLLHDLGHPARSQVALSDARGFVARVDFLVGDRIVVEFDGLMKYAPASCGRDDASSRGAGPAFWRGTFRVLMPDLRHPVRAVRERTRHTGCAEANGAQG